MAYGWDNFTHEVITTGLTFQEGRREEDRLIDKFKATNPEFGYNVSCGTKSTIDKETYKGECILCVELDKVYRNATEAYKELGIDRSSITKACKGSRKSAGGYHWRYINL